MSRKVKFIKAFSKCCEAETVCSPESRQWACTYCFNIIEDKKDLDWIVFAKKESSE